MTALSDLGADEGGWRRSEPRSGRGARPHSLRDIGDQIRDRFYSSLRRLTPLIKRSLQSFDERRADYDPVGAGCDRLCGGGIFHADNRRATERGLAFRPLAETIRDTLDWSRATGKVKRSPLLVQTLSSGKERATLRRFDGF